MALMLTSIYLRAGKILENKDVKRLLEENTDCSDGVHCGEESSKFPKASYCNICGLATR